MSDKLSPSRSGFAGPTSPASGGGEASGQLATNIVYFARALRAAGLPVGPGSVLDALAAVQAAGVSTREDFYWTLHAVFVKRHEHSLLFDQAFRMFFRKRAYLDKLLAMLSPQAPSAAPEAPEAGASRVQEALFAGMNDEKPPEEREIELDMRLTVSDREVLQKKDFAQMSAAEIARAKDAIKRLVLSLDEVKTRRLSPHRRGHIIDMRRTLRSSMKAGGALIDLKYLGPKTRQPPIVALLDISGSMSQYTRLFLHFLHAVTDARKRVYSFLFGTRLTNVSARAEIEGSGRGARAMLGERRGLVGRHAHRDLARRIQQALGAPRAHPGRDRALDHRWAGARPGRPAGVRDRPAAPLLAPADLAQPAAPLRGLRGKGARACARSCPMWMNSGRSIISIRSRSFAARSRPRAGGPAIRRSG